MIVNEICSKIFDGTHDSPKPNDNGKHLLINSKNIKNGNIDFAGAYYISDNDYEKIIKRSGIKKNDILISMIGTIGNVCFVDDESPDYAIKNMGVFRGKTHNDSLRLYYYLQTMDFKIKSNNFLNSSIQKFLTLDFIRNLEIPDNLFYGLDVEKLSNIDRKIKINKFIINVLINKIKDIYSLYFHKFCKYSNLIWNNKVELSIPDNYKIIKLEDLILFEKGIEPSSREYIENPKNKKGLVKFYRVGNLNNDTKTYIRESLAKIKCRFNDILISFDGTIGKVTTGISGAFSSGIQKASFHNSTINNCLIYGILTDERIQKILKYGSNSGSILKHASGLKKYIYMPYNYDDFLECSQKIKPLFELIIKAKRENEILTALKADLINMFIF